MFNNVTVLNAVSRAWREVEVSTIVNVLIYVVLINWKTEESKDIEESEEEDDIPLAYWFVLRKFMGEKNFKNIVTEDCMWKLRN